MRTYRIAIALVSTAAAFGIACGEAERTEPTSNAGVPVDAVHDDWAPAPGPGTSLDVDAAAARRMSVAQLERSLEVVAGFPEGSVQLPANLAFTLGQPDFRSVTEPSREPSPLFMKFMVDLAGFVCGQILEADRARPASQRVLSRHEDLDENLRSVWFRFTGISGADADADVARLREAYQSATASTGDNEDAGRVAVCMAAATSPEFLLY
jgi:hypothetical protein